jgi:hypothetical protein
VRAGAGRQNIPAQDYTLGTVYVGQRGVEGLLSGGGFPSFVVRDEEEPRAWIAFEEIDDSAQRVEAAGEH